MRPLLLAALLLAQPALAEIRSDPSLGVAEGRCRANEPGPAFMVTAVGLKDRQGRLRLEVYPPDDGDFLADDNVLLSAGKTFRRVELPVPPSGPVNLCVRVPAPGAYTVSLLHDRDGNRKFGLSIDGIGFSNNPRLRFSKPAAQAVRVAAGARLTPLTIRMNYRHGLLSFGPLGS